MGKYKSLLGVVFVLFVFLIDRITKDHIHNSAYSEINLIGELLKIRYVENTGVAFGLFKGFNSFFLIFNSLLLGFIFYIKQKVTNIKTYLALHLIIGGALSNIYDRIKFGYVIDFIEFKYFPAIFNLGDFFITTGAIWLLWIDFKEGK